MFFFAITVNILELESVLSFINIFLHVLVHTCNVPSIEYDGNITLDPVDDRCKDTLQ